MVTEQDTTDPHYSRKIIIWLANICSIGCGILLLTIAVIDIVHGDNRDLSRLFCFAIRGVVMVAAEVPLAGFAVTGIAGIEYEKYELLIIMAYGFIFIGILEVNSIVVSIIDLDYLAMNRFPDKKPFPEQHFPNEHYPNEHYPGKHYPNEHYPNEHYPNEHYPNEHYPKFVRGSTVNPNGGDVYFAIFALLTTTVALAAKGVAIIFGLLLADRLQHPTAEVK